MPIAKANRIVSSSKIDKNMELIIPKYVSDRLADVPES